MKNTKNIITEKESDIQKAILQYLELKNIFAWTNKTQGTWDATNGYFRKGNTMKGISDILGIYNGKFLAIEVKRKGNYASPEQKLFIENINLRGGIAFIAYSVDDVISNFKTVDN